MLPTLQFQTSWKRPHKIMKLAYFFKSHFEASFLIFELRGVTLLCACIPVKAERYKMCTTREISLPFCCWLMGKTFSQLLNPPGQATLYTAPASGALSQSFPWVINATCPVLSLKIVPSDQLSPTQEFTLISPFSQIICFLSYFPHPLVTASGQLPPPVETLLILPSLYKESKGKWREGAQVPGSLLFPQHCSPFLLFSPVQHCTREWK